MADNLQCPQCGQELPPDAPLGLCPKCVLNMGVDTRQETQPESRPEADGSSWTAFVPPAPEELVAYFPQLEILELLGQGGMGAVYKARQGSLDRLVALKVLRPSLGEDPAFAERFAREARSLARLNHPNIVGVYDFGQAGGFYYLLMEYVDGVNLRHMAGRAPLASKEALAIVPQICDALQFAHDEGIVHRDIKPENILIDTKGRVKIADFGLAKLLARTPTDYTLTQPQQVMGTPHYMAPEQVEHPATVDQRADIYSLGVVFYEMLTGELPIGRFAPPSKKVEIDVRLDEVVLHALENEPDRRYQQVSQVKTDVEHISSTVILPEPSAAPAGETPPTRRSLRRRVRLLITLVVWTGIFSGGLAYLAPKVWNDWWPWEYKEYGEHLLKPLSGAYGEVTVRTERRVYCWGQHDDRPIFKRPWVGTATIGLPGLDATATLELDPFREQWSWTPPVERVTGSQSEPRPEFVVRWMKAAGLDISKPGVQAEAAALIGMVKDAANGTLPGGKHPRDYWDPGGTKIGPFIAAGSSGGGIVLAEGAVGPLGRHWFGVILILVIWLPGLVIIVRRHRRRLAAAQETEHRYRLRTIGFFAGVLCLAGAAASLVQPWVWLSSASLDLTAGVGALVNWYGIVSILALLTVFVLCFLTGFFNLGRRWQGRAMIVGGAVIVLATGILFWRLTGPPATVRVTEIQLHGTPQTVVLATMAGCSQELKLMRGSGFEHKVPKTMEQNSGPGLWIAFAMGLAVLVLGGLAILWARRQGAGQRRVCSRGAARADVEANADEKTEQMNANSKSNIGKLSLILAIVGAVLPILIAVVLMIVESFTGFMPPYILCLFLSMALEIAALVTGIIGRRNACGKAGLIISAISLVLAAFLALLTLAPRFDSGGVREDVQTFTESSEGPGGVTVLYGGSDWEGLITKTGVEIDRVISSSSTNSGTSLKVVADSPTVVRLFEHGPTTGMYAAGPWDVDNSRLIYHANLRAFRLQGQAYLEMRLHFPDGQEFVSRGLDTAVSGTKDWTSVETSFDVKGRKEPDNVQLNLVIDGKGAVWIDRVTLSLQYPANARDAHRGTLVEPAKPATKALGESKELVLDLGKGVTMKLALIPAGKFMMGAPDSEKWHYVDEEPVHEVTIAKPFYLGVYEVTQEQYAVIMASDLSFFRGKTNPVEMVTWGKAMEFCKKLSEKTGKSVRLPTEAEWEYACRAGTTTRFHTGATIGTDQANYDGSKSYGKALTEEFRQKTVPVGSFKPNGFGLYDMHGNVAEWCSDWYDEKYYGTSPKADPPGPRTGTSRVLRGGSWKDGPVDCRSTCRDSCELDVQNAGVIGFRVAVVRF